MLRDMVLRVNGVVVACVSSGVCSKKFEQISPKTCPERSRTDL